MVFLSLVAYFAWSAGQGDRGLLERQRRMLELEAAKQAVERSKAELEMWQRRMAALRSNHLDEDALDERARAMLNLSDPADIIIRYPDGQKLF